MTEARIHSALRRAAAALMALSACQLLVRPAPAAPAARPLEVTYYFLPG